MQVTLDIGSDSIQNKNILKFIQSKNPEEIKRLFLDFLGKQVASSPRKTENKWAEFGQKMQGLIDDETAGILRESSREFRDNFSLRDLDATVS